MSVDNIDVNSLLARTTAYDNTNKLKTTSEDSIKDAGRFQDIVNVNFNKFASMSPQQILSHIKGVKGSTGVELIQNNNFATDFLRHTSHKIKHQDTVVRKSLVDEASLLDIVSASNEATVAVRNMVAVRDKFFESFEKVMNMAM
jgi:flagellar hook-basal body complex protein FliE